MEDRRCPGNVILFFDGMLCYCQWRFGCSILNWCEQAANTKSPRVNCYRVHSIPAGVCIIKWALSNLKSLDFETAVYLGSAKKMLNMQTFQERWNRITGEWYMYMYVVLNTHLHYQYCTNAEFERLADTVICTPFFRLL